MSTRLPSLLNKIRRAVGRPAPLRLGAMRWLSRDLLSVQLHEPGASRECAELEVSFGVRCGEVSALLDDVCGEPEADRWYRRHRADLLEIWLVHLAESVNTGRAVVA